MTKPSGVTDHRCDSEVGVCAADAPYGTVCETSKELARKRALEAEEVHGKYSLVKLSLPPVVKGVAQHPGEGGLASAEQPGEGARWL